MKQLLLHVCCGPCAIYVAKKLSEDYKVTLFFYNPNIWPEEEYLRRLGAVQGWADKADFELAVGQFNQEDWFKAVQGLENEPEGGARCPLCFKLRLEQAAKYAKENNFPAFASTLTIGRNKKAEIINPIGLQLAQDHGLEFIAGDWKKQGGQEESCRLVKETDMYRQHYCGCKFSFREL
ncbi:MAG: recombinase [Candidatus Komeilibacteria bacterium CG10_big_fil_rev_8_21_14_0_10_41_13]|uniref:Epoxyqueuosine reductase QueH n=1 Tax=Candidatus Komeilibacteria bacterium CG10_big_fil_rev_8_21_14_0_10_41_13 TaxID=1974476 RepID=A0A2M6WBP4_9BACT|nr:MAG: recombinase [Candidatus Komeilibacteria bacterium CG10_big_fil_rev_8_21_14_0_10_41_13]